MKDDTFIVRMTAILITLLLALHLYLEVNKPEPKYLIEVGSRIYSVAKTYIDEEGRIVVVADTSPVIIR